MSEQPMQPANPSEQFSHMAEALLTVEKVLSVLNRDRSIIGLVWMVTTRLSKGERAAVEAGLQHLMASPPDAPGGLIGAFLEGIELYELEQEELANWFERALANADAMPADRE